MSSSRACRHEVIAGSIMMMLVCSGALCCEIPLARASTHGQGPRSKVYIGYGAALSLRCDTSSSRGEQTLAVLALFFPVGA